MSNYSSAKVSQLGSLIVGKPIDTGISARSAQEMLEYVATSYIMQNGANVGGQWHPTLLMATQFPAGAYQSPSLSGTLVLKAMITFRCVRYVPLGGVGAIAPAVQYFPVNVPADQPPVIQLVVGNDYVLRDDVLQTATTNTNLGIAALKSTEEYNLERRPVTDFPGQYASKASNLYCLRPIVSTPEWGQLVFRRNGTWYGGIELDADQTLVGAGKYTQIIINNVAQTKDIASIPLKSPEQNYEVNQVVQQTLVDTLPDGQFGIKDYQNYIVTTRPVAHATQTVYENGQICVFDGRNYSADIKLSEIEDGNVSTDPDQVYFMFSKPSAKMETGRIPDARVDIARKAYFKYSGIHLINDVQEPKSKDELLIIAGVQWNESMTGALYAARNAYGPAIMDGSVVVSKDNGPAFFVPLGLSSQSPGAQRTSFTYRYRGDETKIHLSN